MICLTFLIFKKMKYIFTQHARTLSSLRRREHRKLKHVHLDIWAQKEVDLCRVCMGQSSTVVDTKAIVNRQKANRRQWNFSSMVESMGYHVNLKPGVSLTVSTVRCQFSV